MAELHEPAHCKILQHCINDIVQTVDFNEVKEKLVAKGILDGSEELLNHDNKDAVIHVVKKVMDSTNYVYLKFLEVLNEMEQPQYTKLWQTITDQDNGDQDTFNEKHDHAHEIENGERNTFSGEFSLSDSIKEAYELAEETDEQRTTLIIHIKPLTIKIKEKSLAGKIVVEISINVCRIFRKAIKNDTIRLVGSLNSHKQNVLKELKETHQTLMSIKEKFDPEYPASHQEQKHEFIQYVPLYILLDKANKIAEIVKSIWQPFWRRLSPSKVVTLLSLYDRITTVVQGIRDIDCRPFCELISDIQQLRLCLEHVDTILQGLCNSHLVLCVTLGASAAICVILGVVLIPTPAAAATLPLFITGGVLAFQSSIHMGLAVFTKKVVAAAVDHSVENGCYKGQELLKEVKPPNIVDSQQEESTEEEQYDLEDDTLAWSLKLNS